MGFNAISFYVMWALHEHKRGDITFDGILDLQPFLDAAFDAGLYVIARPGYGHSFLFFIVLDSQDYSAARTSMPRSRVEASQAGEPTLPVFGGPQTRLSLTHTKVT
jgi:hypothetical protein